VAKSVETLVSAQKLRNKAASGRRFLIDAQKLRTDQEMIRKQAMKFGLPSF